MKDDKLQRGDVVKNKKYGHIVVDETFISPSHGLRIKGHTYKQWKRKEIIVDFSECDTLD